MSRLEPIFNLMGLSLFPTILKMSKALVTEGQIRIYYMVGDAGLNNDSTHTWPQCKF